MNEPIQEVYSLLIPIKGGRIILPRAAVVEVSGYSKPTPVDNAPPWMLGNITWNGDPVPLISLEGACGKGVPEPSHRARIALLISITGRFQPNIVALLTQGYPYLVRVNAGVLTPDPNAELDPNAPILCQARMANERPMIPDLERLENMLADALGLPEATATFTSTEVGIEETQLEGEESFEDDIVVDVEAETEDNATPEETDSEDAESFDIDVSIDDDGQEGRSS